MAHPGVSDPRVRKFALDANKLDAFFHAGNSSRARPRKRVKAYTVRRRNHSNKPAHQLLRLDGRMSVPAVRFGLDRLFNLSQRGAMRRFCRAIASSFMTLSPRRLRAVEKSGDRTGIASGEEIARGIEFPVNGVYARPTISGGIEIALLPRRLGKACYHLIATVMHQIARPAPGRLNKFVRRGFSY